MLTALIHVLNNPQMYAGQIENGEIILHVIEE